MQTTYDYLIIGGGSAGCVLANRLSADPDTTVLLLEAGGPGNRPEVKIPALFPRLYRTAVDYAYETVPQQSLNDRRLFLPRGKMLGGSSSMNAMIYIRGNRRDYDEWAELGNRGWSYDEVLPYFKRAEGQVDIRNEYHGTDGPLSVMNRRESNHLSDVFIRAGEELGYPRNPDFNGERQDGFGHYQVTHRNGRRCSTHEAYLKPALRRPNLTVLTHATVTRILTDEGGGAAGAAFVVAGEAREVAAGREVLLCAGAYASPQLLQLSGIGPAEELRRHGIPVVRDLPGVGRNLQDHLVFFSVFKSGFRGSLDSIERFPNLIGAVAKYLLFRRGGVASNLAEAGAFVRSSPAEPVPDIQFHFAPAFWQDHGVSRPGGNGFSIGGKVLNPSSRGSVRLASTDARAAPLIDHNYLTTEDDLRRAIWGFRLGARLGASAAFAPYRTGRHLPENELTTDAEITDYLRATCETLYHPAGTCRMGRDALAVVDGELRVHGVPGLRVVDASVMPNVTRGNTNAPTIMIAERAADLVRGR